MKSSLRRLKGFALNKHDHKDRRRDHRGQSAHQDDFRQAAQDMLDMKNCYDGLLSAAAASANSAFEFSESLKELGTCLLVKATLNNDEEIDRVLLMLGRTQFELQKLVNSYRIHIIQTITTPSESLLKELQTVEEMKRHCDEKRDLYKSMIAVQREKERTKNAKGENFSLQQLQAAHEDYEEEATLFLFRLKSLKQGQSRSLLTQAARHYAAQLNFFRKGVRSLEVVEPHVRLVAEQQHIDYQFSGLEDDDTEENDNDEYEDDYDGNDGELSFDYGQTDQGQDADSVSEKSMELDQTDQTTAQVSTAEIAKEHLDKNETDFVFFSRDFKAISLSAPLLVNKKIGLSEKINQMRPSSTRKFHTYVLPTPADVKSSHVAGLDDLRSAPLSDSKDVSPSHLWHSSPLQTNMHGKDFRDVDLASATRIPSAHSVLKESNANSSRRPIRTSPSFGQTFSSQLATPHASDAKKIKLQAFSGPLIGSKGLPSRSAIFTTDSMSLADYPRVVSVKPTHIPEPQPSILQKSPSASPPLSSPRINELHRLPRPPIGIQDAKRPTSLIAHSAPLVPKGQDPYVASRRPSISLCTASRLPTPPGTMTRSFSIPSSGQRTSKLTDSKLLKAPQSRISAGISSPPLVPISLMNSQRASTVSDMTTHSTKF